MLKAGHVGSSVDCSRNISLMVSLGGFLLCVFQLYATDFQLPMVLSVLDCGE